MGDCFEAAGRWILDCDDPDWVLVHGTVVGTGGEVEGVRYCHAWIEVGELVLDVSNGRSLMIPQTVYYRTGQVEDVVRYTVSEARDAMASGNFGPWAEVFEGFP